MEKDDYQKFFVELASLLEKYNLMIGQFMLGEPRITGTKLIEFNCDGRIVNPTYFVPNEDSKIH